MSSYLTIYLKLKQNDQIIRLFNFSRNTEIYQYFDEIINPVWADNNYTKLNDEILNEVLYEINNDYFQLAQGAFVGKTSNKVGEELELSFLEKNTFTGRKTISPKEKWTIVKVTKNMDPDTVLLFNKDKKVSKTMSLKSFEKNMQRIEKIQRKEERKELKKNEKFACRGE